MVYLGTPSIIGVGKPYQLENAKPYFLNIEGDNKKQEPRRFHLVSPCKADITVTKVNVIAERSKDIGTYDIFNFGENGKENRIDVEKGSLIYNEPKESAFINCPDSNSAIDYNPKDNAISDNRCNGKKIGEYLKEYDSLCEKGKKATCYFASNFCDLWCV